MGTMGEKRINVRVSEEVRNQAMAKARLRGTNLSRIMRILLDAWLADDPRLDWIDEALSAGNN